MTNRIRSGGHRDGSGNNSAFKLEKLGGQDLRAFLFCELLKSLRKAFKSMERFLIPKPKKKQIAGRYASGGSKSLNLGGSNRM